MTIIVVFALKSHNESLECEIILKSKVEQGGIDTSSIFQQIELKKKKYTHNAAAARTGSIVFFCFFFPNHLLEFINKHNK